MKKWKRWIVIGICMGVLCSVTACGNNNDAQQNTDGNQSESNTENSANDTKDTTNNGTTDSGSSDVTEQDGDGGVIGDEGDEGDDLRKDMDDIGNDLTGDGQNQ